VKGERADKVLVERGLAPSRERAQALIMAGVVLVDERPVAKSSETIRPEQLLRLKEDPIPYVSRGGLKLEHALKHWQIDVSALVCADLGASTGGFTDCLLQRGASKVYAIDVGYNQLAWKLRQDPRVVVMEKTNARNLESLPEPISLIVGDLSFISLHLILPAVWRLLPLKGTAVLLLKPQFEVGREHILKGGLADPAFREEAIKDILDKAAHQGFTVLGSTDSPIPGAKAGNLESLVYLAKA
jgi:23S rRNA (cytidine1920-2'-O)/16S rRNA (cytidine1409-2'-O)-methyltransferase